MLITSFHPAVTRKLAITPSCPKPSLLVDRVSFSGCLISYSIQQIQNELFKALKNNKQLMLCFDIDGTLLPYNENFKAFTDKKIDHFLRLASTTYKANGGKIGVTLLTGRSIPQVHALFNNRLVGEPVVILGEDGGTYYNCLTGETDTTASPKVNKAITAFKTRLEQEKIKAPDEVTETRLAWFGTPEFIGQLDQQLEKLSKNRVLLVKPLYNILQVAPKGFDKANGLSMLVDKLGLNPNQNFLFHIGDGRNDFPAFGFIRNQFKNSGLGVLVGRFIPRRHKNSNDPPEASPPAHGYLVPEPGAKAQTKLAGMEESRLLTKTVWWLVERFGYSLREANEKKAN